MIEAAKVTIQTCGAVLDLYNELVDKVAPSGDTQKTASIISNLKTRIANGIEFYENSPKSVANWCVQTTPLLTTYKGGVSTQKANLITALDDGETIIKSAQEGLSKAGSNNNAAGGELTMLEIRLENDYDENVKFLMDWQNDAIKTLVPEIKKKVASIREFLEDFACTQDKVTLAYMDMTNLKSDASTIRTFISLDDIPEIHEKAVQYSEKFIGECNKYSEKYE